MRKLIFITSLEHSGSTILELMLSRHPQLIGCGEVFRTLSTERNIEDVMNRQCNCGKKAEECELWGPVLKTIKNQKVNKWIDRYKIFLEHFYEVYGDNAIAIDSSKFVRAIKKYKYIADNINLKGLFLIRDVRGWVFSIQRAQKRKKEPSLGILLKPSSFKWQWKALLRVHILRSIPGYLPLEWWYRNRKIFSILKKENLKFLQISYEELNFNKFFFERVFNFLGLNNEILPTPTTHIIDGNRTAFKKNIELRYDLKWMAYQVSPIALYLPFIKTFNREKVWGWFDENN